VHDGYRCGDDMYGCHLQWLLSDPLWWNTVGVFVSEAALSKCREPVEVVDSCSLHAEQCSEVAG